MEATLVLDYKGLYEAEKLRNKILEATVSELQISLDAIKHELAQLKKMIFGSRHERFLPASPQSCQLTLDLAADVIVPAVITETKEITITKIAAKPFIHPGRMALPAHLRREETILEPACIPEGSRKIGEEITEELDYTPGELFVQKYIRPKYVVPQATDSVNSEIIIAPVPDRPIDKAMAGPGLLAQIVIDKYVDHLPLYRQIQRFERNGVKLSDSTLSSWISAVCKLLMPLYTALKMEILNSGYIHADETTIKVLDNTKKGTTHHGYFWVYNNSPGRLVLFDYRQGRGAEAPAELLCNYQGYLQTDGYAVYEAFDEKEGIIQLCCMAHARRKFFEAKGNDAVRSEYALEQMQHLYAIERDCKEKKLTNEQKQTVRMEQATPVLEHLGKWMKEQYAMVLPKSPIGQALAYSINRWDKLCIYTTNGMLCIDNNPVENSIRPVAIGRKNYLFAGSHEAAKRSAMLYSLMGTCKLHNINPFTWLREVLSILPAYPINKIKELLPHNYKPKQN
jgi:transposase